MSWFNKIPTFTKDCDLLEIALLFYKPGALYSTCARRLGQASEHTVWYAFHMSFQILLEHLKEWKLPPAQFVIVCSGAMAIRGMREAHDLDIIVRDSLWNQLLLEHPVVRIDEVDRVHLGNDIEIFGPGSILANSTIIPIEEIFEKADVIEGIRFINLNQLKVIKSKLGREKDFNDIQLIDSYVASYQ